MAELNKKFIVNLKGKDFVEYGGLLDLAHQLGLISIDVELLQIPSKENDMTAIAKATARTDKLEFGDIGDASPRSTNSMIQPHIIRMASTRAKARALRDLTNIGMTALEEIMEELNDKPETKKQTKDNGTLASEAQINLINKLMKDKNYSAESMVSYTEKMYNKKSSKELTRQEASALIEMLNGM